MQLLLLLFLLALAPGCMSLEHIFDPDTPLEIYGGVTTSCREMASDETGFFGALCRAIDLPATAAFDTVLLPISIPVQLTRGNGEEEASP